MGHKTGFALASLFASCISDRWIKPCGVHIVSCACELLAGAFGTTVNSAQVSVCAVLLLTSPFRVHHKRPEGGLGTRNGGPPAAPSPRCGCHEFRIALRSLGVIRQRHSLDSRARRLDKAAAQTACVTWKFRPRRVLDVGSSHVGTT